MGQSSDEGEKEEEWEEKSCHDAISEPAYIRSTLNIHPESRSFQIKKAGSVKTKEGAVCGKFNDFLSGFSKDCCRQRKYQT